MEIEAPQPLGEHYPNAYIQTLESTQPDLGDHADGLDGET